MYHTKTLADNSLTALACGDSYGSHYELEGLMGCRFNIASLPNKPKYPNITDDTKMASILLNHYKTYKTLKIDILTSQYQKWARLEGDRDGIGIQTKKVLLEGFSDKSSQGNGALMRCIPFGIALVEDGFSFEEAVNMMNKDASITHANETVFFTNRFTLDITLNGLEAINKPIYKNLLSKLHYGHTAWVIHTLHIVLDALQKNQSFLDGFQYITSLGGDTDTNCAIYGAVLGYKKDIKEELSLQDFLNTQLF